MTMFTRHAASMFFGFALLTFAPGSYAATTTSIVELQSSWDRANFVLSGNSKLDAFDELAKRADRYTADHPQDAEGLIWSGIIKSSYAGAKGGLGALKLAKRARSDFEKALQVNSDALEGSAFTSLGTLYSAVPGWPLGFGDDKKAREFLLKGLEISPQGIDSNFFYAQFLRDEGDTTRAKEYFQKALRASPRAGRKIADDGRQQEIRFELRRLNDD